MKKEKEKNTNVVQKENCKHDFFPILSVILLSRVPGGKTAAMLENITWQVSMELKENKHH